MSMLARVQAEFWSAEDERRLIDECPNFEISLSETSQMRAELEAWRLIDHLYNAKLSDLFTYGLRIGRQTTTTGELAFYQGLCSVLVYPPFRGSLGNLRFVLQMIACSKIEGHAQPFGPVPAHPMVMNTFHELRAKYRGKRRDDGNREDEGAVALALWKDTCPANMDEIFDVLINLDWEIDQWNEKQLNTPMYTQVEREAFVLDADDFGHLTAAIEYTSSTKCQDWLNDARRELPAGTAPVSLAHLETIKNRVAVENERKYRLRKKLLTEKGEAADRDIHVFDIPDGDPDLVYIYAKDIKPDERRVLVGEVMPCRYPICERQYRTRHIRPVGIVGASRSITKKTVFHIRTSSRPQSPDFVARSINNADNPIEIEDDDVSIISPMSSSMDAAPSTTEVANGVDDEVNKALF